MNERNKKNIAVFASGAGTNADNLINYFNKSKTAAVCLIVCNNANAGVLKIAERNNVPHLLIEKEKLLPVDVQANPDCFFINAGL